MKKYGKVHVVHDDEQIRKKEREQTAQQEGKLGN